MHTLFTGRVPALHETQAVLVLFDTESAPHRLHVLPLDMYPFAQIALSPTTAVLGGYILYFLNAGYELF